MKVTIMFLLFETIFILGCTINSHSNKRNNELKRLNEIESFFKDIDRILPSDVDSNYYIIYRFGSIEWCPNTSILCVSKKDFSSYYILSSFDRQPNTKLRPSDAICMTYKFKLEGSKIELNQFKEISTNLLNDEILNGNIFLSEGFCGNLYILKNNEKLYLVNNNEKLKTWVSNLFCQISASEYGQTFSLFSDCDKMDSLFNNLRMNKTDKLNFIISNDKLPHQFY